MASVLVDAFPSATGRLRRWDVVAVSHFGEESGPVVKRLVALPGETWELRQGDLYINGRIERKNLAKLRPLMLTVNDDRFRPTSQQAASRWRSERKDSGWKDDRDRFRFTGGASQTEDWLVYQHQRGLGSGALAAAQATTIKDMDAYNQAESRTLFPVNDVGAAFRVQMDQPLVLDLAVTGHEGRLTCSLVINEGRVVLRDEQQELANRPLAWHDWRRPTQVEFGVCDQQFLVGIDGHDVLRAELSPSPVLPTSQPLAHSVGSDPRGGQSTPGLAQHPLSRPARPIHRLASRPPLGPGQHRRARRQSPRLHRQPPLRRSRAAK